MTMAFSTLKIINPVIRIGIAGSQATDLVALFTRKKWEPPNGRVPPNPPTSARSINAGCASAKENSQFSDVSSASCVNVEVI